MSRSSSPPPSVGLAPSRAAPALRSLGRFCWYGLPLLLWMALIFVMSTHVGASENSASLLERLLGWLAPRSLPKLGPERLDLLNYLVRKAGHVTEYAVLTALAVRAFQRDLPGWRWRAGLGAVALAVLYAASDEWHQRFVPDRTGQLSDVTIDALGVTLGVVVCRLWYRERSPQRRRERGGRRGKTS